MLVYIITVSDSLNEYAKEIEGMLIANNIPVLYDQSSEKASAKIRYGISRSDISDILTISDVEISIRSRAHDIYKPQKITAELLLERILQGDSNEICCFV